eukprot:2090599-Rhodomonas_salina.2
MAMGRAQDAGGAGGGDGGSAGQGAAGGVLVSGHGWEFHMARAHCCECARHLRAPSLSSLWLPPSSLLPCSQASARRLRSALSLQRASEERAAPCSRELTPCCVLWPPAGAGAQQTARRGLVPAHDDPARAPVSAHFMEQHSAFHRSACDEFMKQRPQSCVHPSRAHSKERNATCKQVPECTRRAG